MPGHGLQQPAHRMHQKERQLTLSRLGGRPINGGVGVARLVDANEDHASHEVCHYPTPQVKLGPLLDRKRWALAATCRSKPTCRDLRLSDPQATAFSLVGWNLS